MARSTSDIQRDIERTRNQLAKTLDQLATRTAPASLKQEAQAQVSNSLNDPKVQMILGGIAAGIVLITALSISSKRKEKAQIKEIQRLLAASRH